MEQKKLGFGFMRLPVENQDDPASIDMETLFQMVDTFLERGFTYFDTAYMYHAFKSEIALREPLVKRHDRNSYTVATKCRRRWFCKEKYGELVKEESVK
jgi:uncharacterized protein